MGRRKTIIVLSAPIAACGLMFAPAQEPAHAASCAISVDPRSAARSSATGEAAPETVCCVTTSYRLSATNTRIPFTGVPVFKNGPGPLTMRVAKSYSGSASFQVTVGAEAEAGIVLAKAKTSISASLTLSNETSATNEAALEVPSGKYGRLQYVSWGKDVSWSKVRTNANCSSTVLASGRIKYPTNEEGWYSQILAS